MKKQIVALALSLCLCVSSLTISASATAPDWSNAYKDFIQSGRYVNAFDYDTVVMEPWGSGEKRAMLHDLDADGTPELLISNGGNSSLGRACYIFTYFSNQVAYIGNGPQYPLFYPETSISGIAGDYAPDGNAGTHTLGYRWKDGNTIQREAVYSCDMYGNNVEQLTNNDELFRVCRAGGKSLYEKGVNVANLGNAEWDRFVNGLFPGTIPNTPAAKPSFKDIPSNAYYAAPVAWAVEEGITSGTSSTTFSPNDDCTRGQIVTFLWRAAGSPEPADNRNPFVDVTSGSYYYKPVLWAVENNITSGTDATHFSPNSPCTRGQAVTFLWRAAGSHPSSLSYNPFKDVKTGSYYRDAVLWAAENGITSGVSERLFGPGNRCTRGQIVTFLYRHYVEPAHVVLPEPEEDIYKSITSSLYKAETTMYDIDGNGTDELLVYYGESSGRRDIMFSVYTIKNGSAVPVIENESLQMVVSAPSGGVGVVEKAGKRYLYTCGRNSGYTHPYTRHAGTVRLYSFNGTKLTLADEIVYTLRQKDNSVIPTEVEVRRRTGGKNTAISYSEYQSWINSIKWKASLGDVKGKVNAYF
ncbi:S-layer homology domain-containing protein [Acutalibacter muris]|uniref:S-layer homology domain-containing protein n=1 Tax=Acutalibacter muris TaxID=1796620 RepID=UPI001C3ED4DC|nr:S-layer homology domain-containing protein [Acutalibacter muris]